ncbi:hypothetical protein Slin15195_G005750 [Septoria linicola]|uniref:Uncharacterized protein n=1 Tax=Septoria linicola TaxID=215465 RepID=A0A9Q9AJU7_9PEZI|nr:hypothetical protein Slin15195_G005750 [Septoria linicola]
MTSDLGDGLDAVILERGGRLERVIMNLRKGAPTVVALRRLSRELMLVADSLESAALVAEGPSENTDLAPAGTSFIAELLQHIKGAVEPDVDLCISPANQDTTPDHSVHVQQAVTIRDFAEPRDSLDPDLASSGKPAEMSMSLHSPAARIANRQSIDADYIALRRHFGRGNSYRDEELADMGAVERLERRATRTMQTTPLGAGPDPGMVRLLELGICSSTTTPALPDITVTNDGSPSLPSHILKAQDVMAFGYPHEPPAEPRTESPLMFSPSTCPSLFDSKVNSAEPSPVQTSPNPLSLRRASTWQDLTRITAPAGEMIPLPQDAPVVKPLNPDRDVIRQAMRMDRNKAVQEAAALERQARRRRQIEAGARR